jgi:hypothetical protein
MFLEGQAANNIVLNSTSLGSYSRLAGYCDTAFVPASFATAALRSATRRLISSFAGRLSKGPIFTPGCFDINEIAWF